VGDARRHPHLAFALGKDFQTTCILCNALMMITGVIETFAICRWHRFHWPWSQL